MMKHWIVGYDSHIPLNYTDCSWHTVENRTTITVKNEVKRFRSSYNYNSANLDKTAIAV